MPTYAELVTERAARVNTAPQPFKNEAETYTYLPRGDGKPGPRTYPPLAPQPQNPQPPSRVTGLYYPTPQFYPPYAYPVQYQYPTYQAPAAPVYYYSPQVQYYPAIYYPGQPQLSAPPAKTPRLPNGTLPWYGRTRGEVAHDNHVSAYYGGANGQHNVEPKADAHEMFWVRDTDGQYRSYPLGTIKNTFQGDWKMDGYGRAYFIAKKE